MNVRSSVAGLLCTLALAANAAAEEKHDIRFDRPFVVGQRGHRTVDAEAHDKMVMRAGEDERPGPATDIKIHFEGVEKVLAVDARKRPVQMEYAVERAEAVDTSGTHPLLQKGQVVKVARGQHSGETTVSVDGAPADAELQKLLELVIDLSPAGGATDDDVFGSTERKAVGATWPMHAEIAQKDLAEKEHIKATLSGQTTVLQRTTSHGADCLELQGQMKADIKSIPDMPPGSSLHGATMVATYSGMFPRDASTQPPTEQHTMVMDFLLNVPAGADHPAVTAHATANRSQVVLYEGL